MKREIEFTPINAFGHSSRFSSGWQDLECATIPDQDVTCSVLAFGDLAFEVRVAEGMILDVDGQPSLARFHRRAFGDGPAFKYTVGFQSKIIMQVRGVVFLHHEDWLALFVPAILARFWSLAEVAFCFVGFERHGCTFAGVSRRHSCGFLSGRRPSKRG